MAISLAFALGACGGGGSSNGGSTPSPAPAPAPAPTPAPAPYIGQFADEGILLAGVNDGDLRALPICAEEGDSFDIGSNTIPPRPATLIAQDPIDGPWEGYNGFFLTVGEKLTYRLDWANWSGRYEYQLSDLADIGEKTATFARGGPLDVFHLQLPVETDDVSLQHATFGNTRASEGICFFGAGVETANPSTLGNASGFADGLAYLGADTYRLFGSKVTFTAEFMGGWTLEIPLYGYPGAFGDALDGTPEYLGTIRFVDINDPTAIELVDGPAGFTGTFVHQYVADSQGVIGHFQLWNADGDVIFGAFGSDNR